MVGFEKRNVTLSLSVLNLQWLKNSVPFGKTSSYVDDLISSARELSSFASDAELIQAELDRLENEVNLLLSKKAALNAQLKHSRDTQVKETQQQLAQDKQVIDSIKASGGLGDL